MDGRLCTARQTPRQGSLGVNDAEYLGTSDTTHSSIRLIFFRRSPRKICLFWVNSRCVAWCCRRGETVYAGC